MVSFRSLVVLALMLGAVPAGAQGVLGPGAVTGGKATEEPFPLHATASITNSLGAGTFVLGPTNNPQWQTSLTLQPTVVYKGFVGFVSQTYQLEWTDSDLTTTKNQFELSDLSVGLRYQNFRLPEYGLIFSVGGSAQLPLSMLARQAGSIATVGGNGRVTYFNEATGLLAYGALGANVTASHPALSQRFANNPVKQGLDDAEVASCIVRDITELDNYACAPTPNLWSWRGAVGGSWSGLEGFVFSLDLAYQQLFNSFVVWERDEFTADPAATGLVPRQFMTSNLSATWVAQPWMFLTLGLSTWSPFLAADAKRPRFPLFDFESTRNNLSQFYFDVTFQY